MTVVWATGNPGKVEEFSAMVTGMDVRFVTQSSLGVRSVEETGLTFVENALLKARHAVAQTGLSAIADDSGLVIAGLQGAPGIYSSRYAGEGESMDACIDKVLLELGDAAGSMRDAYFYTAVVYMTAVDQVAPLIVTGQWHGVILPQRQGVGGMGYDPIFYVPTHKCSAAELELAEKNRISHRGQAMAQLREKLGW